MPECGIQILDSDPVKLDWIRHITVLQVNKSMAHRLRGEFTNKRRQQAIFELLGPTYVAIYFPHYEVGLQSA